MMWFFKERYMNDVFTSPFNGCLGDRPETIKFMNDLGENYEFKTLGNDYKNWLRAVLNYAPCTSSNELISLPIGDVIIEDFPPDTGGIVVDNPTVVPERVLKDKINYWSVNNFIIDSVLGTFGIIGDNNQFVPYRHKSYISPIVTNNELEILIRKYFKKVIKFGEFNNLYVFDRVSDETVNMLLEEYYQLQLNSTTFSDSLSERDMQLAKATDYFRKVINDSSKVGEYFYPKSPVDEGKITNSASGVVFFRNSIFVNGYLTSQQKRFLETVKEHFPDIIYQSDDDILDYVEPVALS